jgi:hypothetical protein
MYTVLGLDGVNIPVKDAVGSKIVDDTLMLADHDGDLVFACDLKSVKGVIKGEVK